MTKSKTKDLSETTKAELLKIMVKEKYGRDNFVVTRAIQKGLGEEESSIDLLSRVKKQLFIKNEERRENDWISGEPDIITKTQIRDIKTSWDIFTFFKQKGGKVDKNYYWQVQGYMWLFNKKEAYIDYCLIDTPEPLIEKEKRFFMNSIGANYSIETIDRGMEEIERLHTFGDITNLDERVISFRVERNDEEIEQIKERVIQSREWLNKNFK